MAIIGFSAIYSIASAGDMQVKKIETIKSTAAPILVDKQEDHVIPRRVTEFPIECAKCGLIISPEMKEVFFEGKHYHEDCWQRVKPIVRDQI